MKLSHQRATCFSLPCPFGPVHGQRPTRGECGQILGGADYSAAEVDRAVLEELGVDLRRRVAVGEDANIGPLPTYQRSGETGYGSFGCCREVGEGLLREEVRLRAGIAAASIAPTGLEERDARRRVGRRYAGGFLSRRGCHPSTGCWRAAPTFGVTALHGGTGLLRPFQRVAAML